MLGTGYFGQFYFGQASSESAVVATATGSLSLSGGAAALTTASAAGSIALGGAVASPGSVTATGDVSLAANVAAVAVATATAGSIVLGAAAAGISTAAASGSVVLGGTATAPLGGSAAGMATASGLASFSVSGSSAGQATVLGSTPATPAFASSAGLATVSGSSRVYRVGQGVSAGVATAHAVATAPMIVTRSIVYPVNNSRVPSLTPVLAVNLRAGTSLVGVQLDTDSAFSAPDTYTAAVSGADTGLAVLRIPAVTLTEGIRYWVRFQEDSGGYGAAQSFIPDLSVGDHGEDVFWYVIASDPVPDLWCLVPQRGPAGISVTLLGQGFGAATGTVEILAPDPIDVPVSSWVAVAASPNAYTDARVIDDGLGTSDAEHYEVVVNIPISALSPGGPMKVRPRGPVPPTAAATASGHVTLGSSSAAGGGAFALGVTQPSAANTGPAANGITVAGLTVVNGDLIVNDAYLSGGGSLDRLWIKGHLVFTATTPQTLTNSIIQGRTFTPGSPPYDAIVHARSTSTPSNARISLQFCKVTCVQPDVNLSGAAGERLGSAYRCEFELGSDHWDQWDGPLDIQGCYAHSFSFWAHDPKHTSDSVHPGWAHCDAFQCPGADGDTLIGNYIDMHAASGVGDWTTLRDAGFPSLNYGSCVILTTTNSAHTNARIQQNWLRGGEVHVFMPNNNSAHVPCDWDVSGNRHALDLHGYGSGPYSKQMVRWSDAIGPLPSSVHSNIYMVDATVPIGLRGTTVPPARHSVGSSQYVVDYSSPSQISSTVAPAAAAGHLTLGGSGGGTYDYATFGYGVWGSYKPGASTSGIPVGSPAQTVHTGGTVTITGASVIDLVDYRCNVVVDTSAVVIFTRCTFRGNLTQASNTGLVECRSASLSGSNVRFYDCEFVPTLPSVWYDGIIGHDYKAYRCKVHDVVDGFGVYNTHSNVVDVFIYGCYSYNSSYFASDTLNHSPSSNAAPYGTHNDTGVQWQGGTGLTVVGNNFQGYFNPSIGEASYGPASPRTSGQGGPNNSGAGTSGWNKSYPAMWANSVLQIGNSTGRPGGLLWSKNFQAGGIYNMNGGGSAGSYDAPFAITDNKFGAVATRYISMPNITGSVITGNVRESDGTAVPVNRY